MYNLYSFNLLELLSLELAFWVIAVVLLLAANEVFEFEHYSKLTVFWAAYYITFVAFLFLPYIIVLYCCCLHVC